MPRQLKSNDKAKFPLPIGLNLSRRGWYGRENKSYKPKARLSSEGPSNACLVGPHCQLEFEFAQLESSGSNSALG